MELALRGGLSGTLTPAQCRQDSTCKAYTNVVCYGPGILTDFCSAWRTGIDPPPTVQPPQIDTTPGSPTYGQALLNGQPVATAADAAALLDAQTMQQVTDWQAQNQAAMASQGPNLLGLVGGAVDPVSGWLWPALLVIGGLWILVAFGGRR